MSLTPIYDALVEEAAAKINTVARGKVADARRKRAVEIRNGSCPPWRIDVTIPAGYGGAP